MTTANLMRYRVLSVLYYTGVFSSCVVSSASITDILIYRKLRDTLKILPVKLHKNTEHSQSGKCPSDVYLLHNVMYGEITTHIYKSLTSWQKTCSNTRPLLTCGFVYRKRKTVLISKIISGSRPMPAARWIQAELRARILPISNFRRVLNVVCFLNMCRRFGILFSILTGGVLFSPPTKMEQCVPKRRHIKFTRQGITQKQEYNKNTFLPKEVAV
jgi:hypothetical protein